MKTDLQKTTAYVEIMCSTAKHPSEVYSAYEVGRNCRGMINKPYSDGFNPYKKDCQYFNDFKAGYQS